MGREEGWVGKKDGLGIEPDWLGRRMALEEGFGLGKRIG